MKWYVLKKIISFRKIDHRLRCYHSTNLPINHLPNSPTGTENNEDTFDSEDRTIWTIKTQQANLVYQRRKQAQAQAQAQQLHSTFGSKLSI